MSRQKIAIAAVVVAGSVLFATALSVTLFAPTPVCGVQPGRVQALPPELEFTDTSGKTTAYFDKIANPSLVYFGYSFCPDVCPFDVARNVLAIDELAARGTEVTPVFVTIDPDRDTPDQLQAFVESHHSKMVGLSARDLDQVAAAFGTYYKKVDDDPEFYLMDHSTLTYLVTPDRRIVEIFQNDLSYSETANRVDCIIASDI